MSIIGSIYGQADLAVQQQDGATWAGTIVVAQAETGISSEESTVSGSEASQGGASEGAVIVLEGTSGEEVLGASSHGEETTTGTSSHDVKDSGVFPPFDSSTFGPQLFWLALTFGALYLLMSKIALPRIGEILEVRRDRIEGDLAEAERLRKKTDQAIASYEAELAEARAKSQAIAEDTRASLKADVDAKRAEVEADLTKKVAVAESRIQKTKADALANVDDIAADTAVALVSKLTGKISVKAARSAVATVVKG